MSQRATSTSHATNSRMLNVSKVLVVLVTLTAACDEHDDGAHGVATESVCPPDSTLTYENFAEPFMTAYCVSCHSSERTGDQRNGAPDGHDFDTEEGILIVANHVDEYTAAGPAGVNTLMPPTRTKPTDEERRKLGEWLACEAHHLDDDAGDEGDASHGH